MPRCLYTDKYSSHMHTGTWSIFYNKIVSSTCSLSYYLYSSESIHINLLQEEPEIQELRLNLDGAHEGDCNKPGEKFTAG